jgi:hypothetical protein
MPNTKVRPDDPSKICGAKIIEVANPWTLCFVNDEIEKDYKNDLWHREAYRMVK